jgi:hypothetical protein
MFVSQSRLIEEGGLSARGSEGQIAGGYTYSGTGYETFYAGISEHAWIEFSGVNPNAKTGNLILKLWSEADDSFDVVFRDIQIK